jgi:hypothetical protein
MADTRPSGNNPVSGPDALLIQEVAEIGIRGRLHILPRWAKRAGWLPVPAECEAVALMVLAQPGLISILNWETEGPNIERRYIEIASDVSDVDFEALRAIQDRYAKLYIPKDRRPYLGDAGLQHLGLSTTRNSKSNVYVVVYPGRIEILSSEHRNAKAISGNAKLDDLP